MLIVRIGCSHYLTWSRVINHLDSPFVELRNYLKLRSFRAGMICDQDRLSPMIMMEGIKNAANMDSLLITVIITRRFYQSLRIRWRWRIIFRSALCFSVPSIIEPHDSGIYHEFGSRLVQVTTADYPLLSAPSLLCKKWEFSPFPFLYVMKTCRNMR